MEPDDWEELARMAFGIHGVDPDAVSYRDECEECEKLKEQNEGLRRVGENLQGLINDATSALAKREEELASLKEKKSSKPVPNVYVCPGCQKVTERERFGMNEYAGAFWHHQCWIDRNARKRLAKGRRRLRRWRNFKFFLARAFWFIW